MSTLAEVFRDKGSRVRKVFFIADISDSTKWKEERPETEWLTQYAWFFDTVADIVRSNNGEIVKHLGDGVLACFEEQYATDAINAAIVLQEEIRDETKNQVVAFRCSVAITHGYARQFEIVSGARDFLGTTVDRAFRLCAAANANAIFVDGHTVAAAAMTQVTSRVGEALERAVGDYQGPVNRINLRGLQAPVNYHEIWWDRDTYGVRPGFVTESSEEKEAPGDAAGSDPKSGPTQTTDSDTEQWLRGTVARVGDAFGFINSGGEDFFFNPGYVFSEAAVPEEGDIVCFQPLPAYTEGKNRRASNIFVEGQEVTGTVTYVKEEGGYGFARVNGRGGREHSLFFLFRGDYVPEKEEGVRCEIEASRKGKGPVGLNTEPA